MINKKFISNSFIFFGLILAFIGIFYKDFAGVLYEGELEQLFSYLYLKEYGRPFLTNHPGVPVYYFIGTLLFLFNAENKEIFENVIFLRVVYFLTPVIILFFSNYLTKKFLGQNRIRKLLLFYLIFPLLNIWFYNAFLYLIIFSLGYLTLVLIDIHFLKKKFFILVIFLIGLMLSIYIGSITIAAYFITRKVLNKNSLAEKIYNIFLISFSIFFVYLALTIPIFPDNLEPIQIIITKIIYICDNYFFIFLTILSLIIFLLFFSHKFSITEYQLKIFFISFCLLLPFIFKIIPFLFLGENEFLHLKYLYFDSLISFRLIFPILSMVLFFNYDFLKDKIKLLFIFLFFLISIFNIYYFTQNNPKDLDNFLLKNLDRYEKNHVYFFQNSKFSSEYRFLAWGYYNYGNSSVVIPKKWKKDKIKNFSVIKLREYKLINYDNKIISTKNDNKTFFIKKLFIDFFNLANAIIDKIQSEYLKNFIPNNINTVQKPIRICFDKDLLKKINRSVIIYEKKFDYMKEFDAILKILKSCDKIKNITIQDSKKFKIIKF